MGSLRNVLYDGSRWDQMMSLYTGEMVIHSFHCMLINIQLLIVSERRKRDSEKMKERNRDNLMGLKGKEADGAG